MCNFAHSEMLLFMPIQSILNASWSKSTFICILISKINIILKVFLYWCNKTYYYIIMVFRQYGSMFSLNINRHIEEINICARSYELHQFMKYTNRLQKFIIDPTGQVYCLYIYQTYLDNAWGKQSHLMSW